jgi:hypothetical protein
VGVAPKCRVVEPPAFRCGSPISLARVFNSTQNNDEVNVLLVRAMDVLEIDLDLASEFPAFLQMHITFVIIEGVNVFKPKEREKEVGR